MGGLLLEFLRSRHTQLRCCFVHTVDGVVTRPSNSKEREFTSPQVDSKFCVRLIGNGLLDRRRQQQTLDAFCTLGVGCVDFLPQTDLTPTRQQRNVDAHMPQTSKLYSDRMIVTPFSCVLFHNDHRSAPCLNA